MSPPKPRRRRREAGSQLKEAVIENRIREANEQIIEKIF